jgi:RimJ/RimL family protein N-acetyltransferase
VEIKAAVGNVPSHRVAEKAGAHYEGIQRAALFLHGRAHDAKLWSLTREDLSALPVG